MSKEIFEMGEIPPLGEVPQKMYAHLIREERFGEPNQAFQIEQVAVPSIGDDDCLVLVMGAGINYNNVWAGLGKPVNVIKARQKDGDTTGFHIGGSDASGIVYQVGKNVTNVKVGDEVVAHCGSWDIRDSKIMAGQDPIISATNKIWGYETNYGSFAQFTKVQSHQLLPKPDHLNWIESASYMLVGATAYRMLHGFAGNRVKKNDVVLIWGGAGGLGSMAIQIAKVAGAIPIAVISDDSKIDFCKKLGAVGVINRKKFNHWGMLPHWKDTPKYKEWLNGAKGFGSAIWDILGEKRNPAIVFEHPGENTIPTSCLVCDRGGMVVICAGTTGFNATLDLRYQWMHQKRLQGSHFANDEQAMGINDLVRKKLVDPCLAQTFSFEEIGKAHQLMFENKHSRGNMAITVCAQE